MTSVDGSLATKTVQTASHDVHVEKTIPKEKTVSHRKKPASLAKVFVSAVEQKYALDDAKLRLEVQTSRVPNKQQLGGRFFSSQQLMERNLKPHVLLKARNPLRQVAKSENQKLQRKQTGNKLLAESGLSLRAMNSETGDSAEKTTMAEYFQSAKTPLLTEEQKDAVPIDDPEAAVYGRTAVALPTASGATIIMAKAADSRGSDETSKHARPTATQSDKPHRIKSIERQTYRGDGHAAIPYSQQQEARRHQLEILDVVDYVETSTEIKAASNESWSNQGKTAAREQFKRASLASRLGVGANTTFGSVLAFASFQPPQPPLPPQSPAVSPPFSVFPTTALFRNYQRLVLNSNPSLTCAFTEQRRPDGTLKPARLVTQSLILLRSKVLERLLLASVPFQVLEELQQQQAAATRKSHTEHSVEADQDSETIFEENWKRTSLFESTPHSPGSALACDHSGNGWGMSSAFQEYTGTALAMAQSGSQATAGRTQMLLQSSEVPFGWQTDRLDLRGWHVSPMQLRSIALLSEHVENVEFTAWQTRNFDINALETLFNELPKLKRLVLPGCEALNWRAAESLAASPIPLNLTQLDISESENLDDKALTTISAACINLRDLSVSRCPSITDSALVAMASDLAKLTSLDLSWCLRVTNVGIIPLLARCPIAHFSVRGVGRAVLTADDASSLATKLNLNFQPPHVLPSGWRKVEATEQATCVVDLDGNSHVDSSARGAFVVPLFPGLRGGEWLRQELMGALVEVQISSLRTIDMSMCVGVTDEVVISLLRNSTGLERIRLSHCEALTAATTTAIGLFCPRITELHMPFCFNITSPILDREVAVLLATRAGMIRTEGGAVSSEADGGITVGLARMMNRSETARVRYSLPFFPGDDFDSDRFDDKPMDQSGILYPQWSGLKILNFSGSSGIQQLDLSRLAKCCPNLHTLRCTGVHNLTSQLLHDFQPLGLPLMNVSMGYLPALDDDAVKTLVQCSPDLRQLDITGSTSVSDAGLAQVAMNCPLLTEFRLNDCSRTVSCGAVMALAKSCRLLRVLEVSQRPKTLGSQERLGPFAHLSTDEEIDYSFDGDLLLFVVGLGLCCPYLEKLDISGRRLPAQTTSPRGLGASIQLDGEVLAAGSARGLVQRAKAAEALGVSKRSSAKITSILSGNSTVESLVEGQGENLLSTSYRPPLSMSSQIGSKTKAAASTPASLVPVVSTKNGPVTSETVFAVLKSLNLAQCSALSTSQATQIIAAAPLLLHLDLTGVNNIDIATISEIGHKRDLVNFCIEYEHEQQPFAPSTAILAFPGQRPGSKANVNLQESLVSQDRPLSVARNRTPNVSPKAKKQTFVGFRPVPGATFLVDSNVLSQRVGLERVSANKIRNLILHGLRIKKQLLFTLTWRVRIKRKARLQYSARRITRFVRHAAASVMLRKMQAASAIAMWWRRLQVIFRCQERIMAAIQAKRSAQTKVLAASLLVQTFNGIWQRLGFNWLRMRALVGRWEDERRVNRIRGLVPRYDARGRLNVQFALPESGPEVLGANGPPTSPIPKRPQTQQGQVRTKLDARIAAASGKIPQNALSRLVQDGGGLRLKTDDDANRTNIIQFSPQEITSPTSPQKSSEHGQKKHFLAYSSPLRAVAAKREQIVPFKISADISPPAVPKEWDVDATIDLRPYRTSDPFSSNLFLAKFVCGEPLRRQPEHAESAEPHVSIVQHQPRVNFESPSPYRLPSGKIHAVLSNPARVGWDNPMKAPPVSEVHTFLQGVDHGRQLGKGDMLLQLANSQVPIESMQTLLGPRAFIAAAKKRIGIELADRYKSHASWKEQQLKLLKACEKRARRAAARKIQLFYRQHLFERVIGREFEKAKEQIVAKQQAADSARHLHRRPHSGPGSKSAIKAAILIQKAIRGYSAKLFALHYHRAKALTNACDEMRVAAAIANGADGEFGHEQKSSVCYNIEQHLQSALGAAQSLTRFSRFFRRSPIAAQHNNSIHRALQLCAELHTLLLHGNSSRASTVIARALEAASGSTFRTQEARSLTTIETNPDNGCLGAMYNQAGKYLSKPHFACTALSQKDLIRGAARRFLSSATAGQLMWLQTAASRPTGSPLKMISINTVLCSLHDAQNILAMSCSSASNAFSAACLAKNTATRSQHDADIQVELLPGECSLKMTVQNPALSSIGVNCTEIEIVQGALGDVAVLLEPSQPIRDRFIGHLTVAFVIRSKDSEEGWSPWKLAFTVLLAKLSVPPSPLDSHTVQLPTHQEAIEAFTKKCQERALPAIQQEQLAQEVKASRQLAQVEDLDRGIPRAIAASEGSAQGQHSATQPDAPEEDEEALQTLAEFGQLTNEDVEKNYAAQLAIETYDMAHGLLSWADLVAARMAREQRHWLAQCHYQKHAQHLGVASFRGFFEQELPLMVSDSRSLVERSQEQSHDWITRWQRSFGFLEDEASKMPKFSDARCRLNYERQQLRVALMRARMASEQSHVSFAKQSLLALSELESQQKSLMNAVKARTSKEAHIITCLEQDIPKCERVLEFARARLARLTLGNARASQSKGSRADLYGSQQDVDEADELAALVSMMSGEQDSGVDVEYGALPQEAASQSETEQPLAHFERILQIEPIDDEWERVQTEKIVEVEVPVEYPWKDSGNWTQHRNEVGQVYYFNKLTEQSQWEEPSWPDGERPPPLTEKVHKVEWVKRRRAESQHERRKKAKQRRRSSNQLRSSIGMAHRVLSETSLHSFSTDASPQEKQMEIEWLRAEIAVLEDTVERLQNVLFATAVEFHQHNLMEHKLLTETNRILSSLQAAVEEHRRAKVEVLQLKAESATDSYFNTNRDLVGVIRILDKQEKRRPKRLRVLRNIEQRILNRTHEQFSRIMPLREVKFAQVHSARQARPHAPKKIRSVELVVQSDASGKEVAVEREVLKLSSPRPRRFRYAFAPPTAKSLLFYSATSDGEDVNNPAFWYCGAVTTSIFGLFGVEIKFGAEPSKNVNSDDEQSDTEAEQQAKQESEARQAALLEAQTKRQELQKARRLKAELSRRNRLRAKRKGQKAGRQQIFADMEGTPAGQSTSTEKAASKQSLADYLDVLHDLVPGFSKQDISKQTPFAQQISSDSLACLALNLKIARKRGAIASQIFVETLKAYPSAASSDCISTIERLHQRTAEAAIVANRPDTKAAKAKEEDTPSQPKGAPPEIRLLSRASEDDGAAEDGEFRFLFQADLEQEQSLEEQNAAVSLFAQASSDAQDEAEAMREVARKSPFPWKSRSGEWQCHMSEPRSGSWGSTYYIHLPSKTSLWVPPSVASRTSLLKNAKTALIAARQRAAALKARQLADLKKRKQEAESRFLKARSEVQEIRSNFRAISNIIESEAPDATGFFLNQPAQNLLEALKQNTATAREIVGIDTSEEFPEFNFVRPFAQWTDSNLLPALPQLPDIVQHFACFKELELFKTAIFDHQARIDARDRPEWWQLMQLNDQQEEESRGFGGEAYFAESPEEYTGVLQKALGRAVDRLLACEYEEQQLRFQLMKTLNQLHDSLDRQPSVCMTNSVHYLREQSIKASDTIARRKFDRAVKRKVGEAEKTLSARLAQKARLIFDISEESGTTQQDLVARLRQRARVSKMAKLGVDAVPPDEVVYDSDEEAFFEWKRDNIPKFESEGFKGVIGPDGAALQYLGDGTSFSEVLWMHRYKMRPWVTGAKLLASLSIGDGSQSIMDKGMSFEDLKDYKLGSSTLAASGLEAKRQKLQEKRAKREAVAKADKEEEAKQWAEKVRRKMQREVTKQQDYRRQVGVNSAAQARLTVKEIKSVDKDTAGIVAHKGQAGRLQEMGNSFATKFAAFSRKVRTKTRKVLRGSQPERDASGYQVHRAVEDEKTDAELRTRNAEGKLAAVNTLRFVGGKVANAQLARSQAEKLRATGSVDGLYYQLKGNLGSDDFPIHLWYTRTSNMLEAAGHMILNSMSSEHPLHDDLQFNGYNYYTDPKVLPNHACWILRGTGAPITALAVALDETTATQLRAQRFQPVQGGWGESRLINAKAQLFYRAEVVLRVNSFKMDEFRVLECELAHLRALHLLVKAKLDAASADPHGPSRLNVDQDHFLTQEIKRLDGTNAPLQEGRQIVIAAEVLGLSDGQVEDLRQSFERIGLGRDSKTTLPTVLRYVGVRATPLYDALILALDKSFEGSISFGMFMRTVVTLCMHDFEDLCGFLFGVVAPNLLDAVHVYKQMSNALYRESTSLHCWWHIGEAWRGPGHMRSPTLLPVLAFEVLLKSMHPPSNFASKAIQNAIDDAMSISAGDCISFTQFESLVQRHVPLFHPVLEFQQALRRSFPNANFWKQPVKHFGQIRSSWRDQLLSRETENMKRSTEWLQQLEECLPFSDDVLNGPTDPEPASLPALPQMDEHVD